MEQAQASWKEWLQKAFLRGASLAHRFSKQRGMQDILDAHGEHQPYERAEACLQEWQDIWSEHEAAPIERPPDIDSWPQLPPITVQDLISACRLFPERTALGPFPRPPARVPAAP